jgi:hypothetical protein
MSSKSLFPAAPTLYRATSDVFSIWEQIVDLESCTRYLGHVRSISDFGIGRCLLVYLLLTSQPAAVRLCKFRG